MALTAAAWADCVAWDQNTDVTDTVSASAAATTTGSDQDEVGRLWDVLTMARLAARGAGRGARVDFRVLRVPLTGDEHRARETVLFLHIGPGDIGEPVATIMRPDGD